MNHPFRDLVDDIRQEWRAQALCAQVGGDLWFADKGDWASTVRAKIICRRCPVRQECLSHALERGELFGVWGGLAPKQREALKRQSRGDFGGLAS